MSYDQKQLGAGSLELAVRECSSQAVSEKWQLMLGHEEPPWFVAITEWRLVKAVTEQQPVKTDWDFACAIVIPYVCRSVIVL
jgi:hypothetical protein